MRAQALLCAIVITLSASTAIHARAAAETSPGLPDAKWRSWQTGALRADRLQHASLSATTALGIGLLSEEPAVGFAGSLGLGIGKEVIDMSGSRFDWGDLLADAIGAGLGALAAAAVLR